MMRTDDFDFILPEELIAQLPTQERRASRLLHLDGRSGDLCDTQFCQFPDLLSPDDLLIFNDTRVIKARLFGHKASGGKLEILIERVTASHEALAQVRASKSPKPGQRLLFLPEIEAEVLERRDDMFLLRFFGDVPLTELLEQYGTLPLPPYIQHKPDEFDEERYQTIYASAPGAVAAPTAGLHFDQEMLKELAARNIKTAQVTLHVGAGTFQPVRTQNIAEHHMHRERYTIPLATVESIVATQNRGGRVTAVGTTTLRALESAMSNGHLLAGEGDTDIFIKPGYQFQVVDRLLTNFHLPKSTLLMLVSAFAGMDSIRQAYAHAVEEKYRFFSYGDAMLIERKP